MRLLLTASTLVLSLFWFASCNPKKEDPVEAFKEQVKSLDLQGAFDALEAAEEDPSSLVGSVDELISKVAQLKTAGLPDDLKNTTIALQVWVNALAAHITKMPIPADVLAAGAEGVRFWLIDRIAADRSFMESFEAEMEIWNEEMDEVGQDMEFQAREIKAVYEKYEIPIDFPEMGGGDDEVSEVEEDLEND